MIATPAAEEVLYRPATLLDVSAIAQLRPEPLGNAPDWDYRLAAYLSGEFNPRQALPTRVIIVAEQDDEIIGFIAGHLTRRFHCQGELQWINVSAALRRQGVATELLRELAGWFAAHNAHHICVDAKPRNADARAFYIHNGAEPLNDHWMVWPNIVGAVPAP
jgi:ribosomal protein S18 acetylase RimI-like enzyme